MKALVSIIIPVYNRAEVIKHSLNSILKQTYQNWECIIVDDSSTDSTLAILREFTKYNPRFSYYERPGDRRKGANACRNYGFEKSKGDFIQWFDSDDLMHPDCLMKKVNALENSSADFVIAKSYYFKQDLVKIASDNSEYYRFNEYRITNFNYVTQKINWLTYDFMGRRALVEKVSFNENLQAFQERNYFCKLTCFSEDAIVLDEYLTFVRIHKESIQAKLKKNTSKYYKSLHKFFFETWKELKPIASTNSLEYLFLRNLRYAMHFKTEIYYLQELIIEMVSKRKYRAVCWFILFQLSFRLTGRGNVLRKNVLTQYE